VGDASRTVVVAPGALRVFVIAVGGPDVAARLLGARAAVLRRALRGEAPKKPGRLARLWERFDRVRKACAESEVGHVG